jgi:hypothetical protein
MLFVDDLQWAGPTSAGIIDLVLREPMEGLMLVAAHRSGVHPAEPLALSLARWRGLPGLTHLQLTNLPSPSLVALVAEVLRVDEAAPRLGHDHRAPHRGQPLRDGRIAQQAASRGRSDTDLDRVAVERTVRALAAGPV